MARGASGCLAYLFLDTQLLLDLQPPPRLLTAPRHDGAPYDHQVARLLDDVCASRGHRAAFVIWGVRLVRVSLGLLLLISVARVRTSTPASGGDLHAGSVSHRLGLF